MSKFREKLNLLLLDVMAINAAFFSVFWAKYVSGKWGYLDTLWHHEGGIGQHVTFSFALDRYLWPMVVISVFWLILFAFYGLYRSWRAQSRLDEFVAVGKIVSLGVLVLFLLTFDISDPFPKTRMVLFAYWMLLMLFVGAGRIGVRTFQRRALAKGFGGRRSVIVGTGRLGHMLLRKIQGSPALGYRIEGLVAEYGGGDEGERVDCPVLGNAEELPRIITDHRIEEVLIAADSSSHQEILDMVSRCNGRSVTFGIIPDLYDIVSGHVRTQEIYGFPVMELLPDLMPAWEKTAKRLVDVIVSLVILIGMSAVWALVALSIKLDSRGPVFFVQKRVGRDGKIFRMGKFRSMVENAEGESGPVWAGKNDPRITRVGRIIRRLKIDEVPQLYNVLRGDMSLVGPRPERPFFVETLEQEIPLYRRRLRVVPGLTGWAQTNQGYDTSIEDVKEKLKYDLYYIENMSLRMDTKILLRTLFVALRGTEIRLEKEISD
ncbi:MAG: sugar transferase [Candidatus Latescibacterota bacterium]